MLVGCGIPKEEKKQEEQRIVATSVAVCEILDRLEVDTVVGIPKTDAYTIPKAYESLTQVGSPMGPNMEIVKSLEPTMILSPNSLQGELKPQYDGIAVDSYFLDLKSVEGMYQSIKELGEKLNKEEQADRLVQEYEKYKEQYQKLGTEKAPDVLILMGLPGSYVVATESSYVGSLVKLAGGNNVYGDGEGTDFLNVNTEDMLKKEPDLILRTSHAMPEIVKKMFAEEFTSNDIWQHFQAVQEDKVYDLDNELFGMSANFRYPEALEALQPILFEK